MTLEKIPFNRLFIDLAPRCNLRCAGCFQGMDNPSADRSERLALEEVKAIIDYAGRKLPGVSVTFAGKGEPTMDPIFWDALGYAKEQKVPALVFTNATMIKSPEQARTLMSSAVAVITKMNTLNQEMQDALVGVTGAARRMHSGIMSLCRARNELSAEGKTSAALAVDSYIVQQNYSDIVDVLRWCRQQKVIPYFSALVKKGLSESTVNRIGVGSSSVALIFHQLSKTDLKEFGIKTQLHPDAIFYGGPPNRDFYHISVRCDGSIHTNVFPGNRFLSSIRDSGRPLSAKEIGKRLQGADEFQRRRYHKCNANLICNIRREQQGPRVSIWQRLFGRKTRHLDAS